MRGWFWRGRAVFVSKRFCCFRWGLGRVKLSDGLGVCAGQSVFGGGRVGGAGLVGCIFAGQSFFWWRVFGWFGMGVRERNDLGAFLVCVMFGRVGFWVCYYI